MEEVLNLEDLLGVCALQMKEMLDNNLTIENIITNHEAIEREICIGAFDPVMASDIISRIRFYNALDDKEGLSPEDRKPIKLIIDSCGGDLTACFSIIDAIELSKTPVHAYVIGNALSCGFLLTINCHKRFGYAHSTYLFHKGSAGIQGTADQVKSFTKYYDEVQLSQIKDFVLTKTNITPKKYKSIEKDDYYISAKEALKLGVIDEILGAKNEGNN